MKKCSDNKTEPSSSEILNVSRVNKAFECAEESSSLSSMSSTKADKLSVADEAEKNDAAEETNVNHLEKDKHFVHSEGGWGWLVVLSAGYCFGIFIGMSNNYGLILNELADVYVNTPNSVVYAAWISSMSVGLMYFMCPIGSLLIEIFDHRVVGLIGGILSGIGVIASAFVTDIRLLFLTYGLIFGIGQSLLLAATFAILPHYFKKRIGLAMGLMNVIGAIVICILPVLTGIILRSYRIRGTFIFLGILNCATTVLSLTFVPKLPAKSQMKLIDELKRSFGLEVFKKKNYVVWCIATFFGMFGYMIPLITIDHYCKEKFPEQTRPEILNITFGAITGASALIFGRLGDYTKFNRVHYHTLVYILYGTAQLCMPFTKSFAVFLVLFLIMGIGDGIFLCFKVTIANDLAESPRLANQASGYIHSLVSPTVIFGPAAAGFVYEQLKSYDYAYMIGGLTNLLAALILIVFILIFDFFKDKCLLDKSKSASEVVKF